MIAVMPSSTMPPTSTMPGPADLLPDEAGSAAAGGDVGVTVPDGPGTDVISRARAAAAAVDLVVQDAHASIPGWDNLAFIGAFARAAERAREVLRTSTHAVERRLVASRLLRLMPPALLPAEHRDRVVALNLPEAVLARADNDFILTADDAPHIHPSWTAFLTRAGVVDDVLRPGRHELLLAPRSLSPFDAVGSNVLVRVVGPLSSEGALPLEIVGKDGEVSRRRRTSDGKDAGLAELRPEVLISWLRHGGPGSRGLDLRRADDRCLLLTFNETLRERRLDVLLARSAGDDGERRAATLSAVVDAAVDAVAFAALDPLACRFVFPIDGDPQRQRWVDSAIATLTSLGLAAEIAPRVVGEKTREVVWLDAVVDSGFVGGAMSAVAQARAFARLAVSVLAPLGAVPLVGCRSGNGVVLTLLEEQADGARQRGPLWASPAAHNPFVALAHAWTVGQGRMLPAPATDTAHDLQSMPAWLQSFANTIVDAGGPPTDAERTAEAADDARDDPRATSAAPAGDTDTDDTDTDDDDDDIDLEVIDDDAVSAINSAEGDAVVEHADDGADVDISASTLRPKRHNDVDGESP